MIGKDHRARTRVPVGVLFGQRHAMRQAKQFACVTSIPFAA
jgi:hypothetical protein